MNKVKALSLILGLTSIFAAASCWAAPVPAWEFTDVGSTLDPNTGGSTPNFGNSATADPNVTPYYQWLLGNTFYVSAPGVTVSALGYYDQATYDSNQLNLSFSSHEVALYDIQGNLLASTTVTSADQPPVIGTHFRYDTISPVVLGPGYYQIDALSHLDNYTWNDTGFATDPNIGSHQDISTPVDLTLPVLPGSSYPIPGFQDGTDQSTVSGQVDDGFWGPDFLLTPVTAVPEPSTLLLLGSALVGLAASRKKSKAA